MFPPISLRCAEGSISCSYSSFRASSVLSSPVITNSIVFGWDTDCPMMFRYVFSAWMSYCAIRIPRHSHSGIFPPFPIPCQCQGCPQPAGMYMVWTLTCSCCAAFQLDSSEGPSSDVAGIYCMYVSRRPGASVIICSIANFRAPAITYNLGKFDVPGTPVNVSRPLSFPLNSLQCHEIQDLF